MYKMIVINDIRELECLQEDENTLVQLRREDGTTDIYKKIDGRWTKVDIYNG